jgi:putative cardiolipin synthase
MQRNPGAYRRRTRAVLAACAAIVIAGCTTLPPNLDAPKPESTAWAQPEDTTLGKRIVARAKGHGDLSGFALLADGANSFAMRLSIAAAAERTLDVQYFLLQQDDTGTLLLGALLAAADRGVRVRLLLDDALGFDSGSLILPLAAHPNIEVRIFNPFLLRQDLSFLRGLEYVLEAGRVNYRMHNKLFIADNAIAVTGGRNVGDEYFQASNERDFGDFDLVAAGPIVRKLSRSFDKYWNDRLAVPVGVIATTKPTATDLEHCRAALLEHEKKLDGSDYVRSLAKRDALGDLLSGKRSFIWAETKIAFDSPDKAAIIGGTELGHLMWKRVETAVEGATSELMIVSPYLVPGEPEMDLLRRLRERGVRVRILTNSLSSTDMPIVHAAYRRYRVPMLQEGIELYEVQPHVGAGGGSGIESGSSGPFALHAKVFVIDRKRVFVGSMNFDRRSLQINTEIGLIIDSPELAREIAKRFDVITQPANSYRLVLDTSKGSPSTTIRWLCIDDGQTKTYDTDPGVDEIKRNMIDALSVLPLDDLL